MDETNGAPAPADRPGFLLWRISNAWQRAVRTALDPFGVTHAQYVLLATLDWLGRAGPAKQHEIATLAGMDPMTTSQVLRTLEGRDLVRRQPHPVDKRAFTVALTASGRRTLRRVAAEVEAAEAAFFSRLDRQQRSVFAALRTLADA